MNGKEWVVELEPGVWIAPINGDPGRTLIKASATRFASQYKAELALQRARKSRPFLLAEVQRTF